jgi:hypothetical protein
MQLFQFAGEMGSARVSRAAVGVPPNARCGSGSQRDVANGDRDGRAPQHDVQHVQRPATLGDGNAFQRFDATEFFADFGCTFYFEFNYANPTICT